MKNEELLNPLVDIIFKAIFGSPKNTDILSSFIKSVLNDSSDEYESIKISDTNLKVESKDDKLGILDVKVHTKSGQIIDVEVQILPVPEFKERLIFYTSKMITEQINKGEPYSQIKKVVSIAILDFKLIKENDVYHNAFTLYDKNTQTQFSEKLEIHTLELPKLPSSDENTNLMNWLKFLKSETKEDFELLAEKSPELQKAYEELAHLSQDENTRKIYEATLKARRDEISRIEGAKKEGIKQGLEQGLEQGKIERDMEIAKEALKAGSSIDFISRITGLDKSTITIIKEEIGL